jgi:molybdopterin adenylyltransferase
MPGPTSAPAVKIGRLTISDRASAGVYEDLSGPAIEEALAALFGGAAQFARALVPDERPKIAAALRGLCDDEGCALVVTTGGTRCDARGHARNFGKGVARLR